MARLMDNMTFPAGFHQHNHLSQNYNAYIWSSSSKNIHIWSSFSRGKSSIPGWVRPLTLALLGSLSNSMWSRCVCVCVCFYTGPVGVIVKLYVKQVYLCLCFVFVFAFVFVSVSVFVFKPVLLGSLSNSMSSKSGKEGEFTSLDFIACWNQSLVQVYDFYFQELREPFLKGMQAKMASIKSEVNGFKVLNKKNVICFRFVPQMCFCSGGCDGVQVEWRYVGSTGRFTTSLKPQIQSHILHKSNGLEKQNDNIFLKQVFWLTEEWASVAALRCFFIIQHVMSCFCCSKNDSFKSKTICTFHHIWPYKYFQAAL